MAYAIHGMIGAPYMAMFALGMLAPKSNSVVSRHIIARKFLFKLCAKGRKIVYYNKIEAME